MEPLLAKRYPKQVGLTLIEVLIALAIIAVAMTAIIKTTGQNIRGTSYLENKTIAMWVGQRVINSIRIGILRAPNAPDKLTHSEEALGKMWYWQATLEDTPNKRIKKIIVNVSTSEEEEANPILSLESYTYNEK